MRRLISIGGVGASATIDSLGMMELVRCLIVYAGVAVGTVFDSVVGDRVDAMFDSLGVMELVRCLIV